MKLKTCFALLALVLTPGCASDETGEADTQVGTDAGTTPDTGTTDSGPINQDLSTVAGLQQFSEAQGCDPQGSVLTAPGVTLSGIIVTSGRLDAFTPDDPSKKALDGYFVADAAGGDFSGLFVVFDRDLGTDFKAGDVMDVGGDLEERFCFTQLYATTHTITGVGAEPAAAEVTPETLGTEANESRVVTLKNIEVLEKTTWGGYVITGGVEVAFGFPDFFLNLNVGGTYDLTGVVKYAYEKFQLIPRSDADIVNHGGGGTESTILALQSGDASVGCTDASNTTVTGGVTLEGIVAHERISLTSDFDGYYLTNGDATAHSGIIMVISKNAATNFPLGAKLSVVGDYKEYYCLSELVAQSAQLVSEGEAVPAAVDVGSVSDLLAIAEDYEGMLITVTAGLEVTNTDDWDKYGYVAVNDSELLIEGKILHSDDFPPAAIGDSWDSVTGFLTYSFGNYRLQPRSLEDFASGAVTEPAGE